jgi:hypothetical protein
MAHTDDYPDRDEVWIERYIDSSPTDSNSNGHSAGGSAPPPPDNLPSDQSDLYRTYDQSKNDPQRED